MANEETIVRLQERYKKLLTIFANSFILFAETIVFAYMWYLYYCNTLAIPLYEKGNWAVIGIYTLILFFFTNIMEGYKIGHYRMMDTMLSHTLAICASNIVAYVEICLIARSYANPIPVLQIVLIEIAIALPWIFLIRKIYGYIYPPVQLLVIYGQYSPEDLIRKINSRKDKYNVCSTISCQIGMQEIEKQIKCHEAVLLCDLPGDIRNDIMKYCYEQCVRTYVTPKISDLLLRSAEDIHLFDTPLLLQSNLGISGIDLFIKRVGDVVLSLVVTLIASPVMVLIGLLIKIYDGGPIFYKQTRLTKDEKEFEIYKFRSMCINSEEAGARLAMKEDKRVTPIGKVIRNIHFDELPQLLNILKGDMSFVGPRPERREIFEQYLKEIPEFNMRLKVKAGLTGYAQVYGKYNTTPYDKLKLDLTYIRNYSFWLDIKLILLTVKILFQKENAEGVDKNQITASRK